MNRKTFLKSLALLPLAAVIIKLNQLQRLTNLLPNSATMPLLFLGHGSPMNAIVELALQQPNETATLFNNKAVAGSLTMTSVKIA